MFNVLYISACSCCVDSLNKKHGSSKALQAIFLSVGIPQLTAFVLFLMSVTGSVPPE